jgi:MYXO-CTERM domain-containing protein
LERKEEKESKHMMETATIRVICGLLAVLLLALIILRRRQRAQQD